MKICIIVNIKGFKFIDTNNESKYFIINKILSIN
jgi:hypothetical protein